MIPISSRLAREPERFLLDIRGMRVVLRAALVREVEMRRGSPLLFIDAPTTTLVAVEYPFEALSKLEDAERDDFTAELVTAAARVAELLCPMLPDAEMTSEMLDGLVLAVLGAPKLEAI